MRAGEIRFSIPSLAGASYRQEQDLYQAELWGIFAKGENRIQIVSRVTATAGNYLVVEVQNQGASPCPVVMETTAPHTDFGAGVVTTEGAGVDEPGQIAWVERGTPKQAPAIFVMKCAMAAKIIGAPCALAVAGSSVSAAFSVPAGAAVTAVIAIHVMWNQGNSFCEIYPAAVQCGYDPGIILAKMNALLSGQLRPNGVFFQEGGGIETVGAIEAIDCMLLESTEGMLKFFPVWDGSEAKFVRLRAVGAFLVSAELKHGAVQKVTLTSEKGRQCRVKNPWPGHLLTVQQVGGSEVATPMRETSGVLRPPLGGNTPCSHDSLSDFPLPGIFQFRGPRER